MNPEVYNLIKLFIGAIVALVGAVILSLKIMDRRIARNNPGNKALAMPVKYKAGHGDMCGDHDRAIAKLETSLEMLIDTVVPELKDHIEKNFNKIYDLIGELNSGARGKKRS